MFRNAVSAAADRSIATTTLEQFNTPSLGLGAKIEIRPPVGHNSSLRIGSDIRISSGSTNEFFRYQSGVATRLRRAGGINGTFGGFIEGSRRIGPLTLTGGARLDRWSIKRGFLTESVIGTGVDTLDLAFANRSGIRPTFRGGALLKPSDALDLRVAGYTGFRVPTLNELYRPFRVGADATAANGALSLEKLKGFEGGIELHAGKATLGLTAFWNQLDGAIANVTLGAGPAVFPQVGFVAAGGVFRQRLNVDAIEVNGIEATVIVPLGDFKLSGSYAYTDARVRASGSALPLDGKRPAQTPEHQGSATLAYSPAAGPHGSISIRYAGAQFEDDLQTRQLPKAFTVDGVVSVPIVKNIRIVARAENLFDEKVVSGISSTGVGDLGTPQTFWLGLMFGR
jgi:vitamin B12 transporter